MLDQKLRCVVLISGNGSNLQSIIDAQAAGLPIEIARVLSNRANAYGLERARQAGIATSAIDHTSFGNREDFDKVLIQHIDPERPSLIVLAGFMRILTPRFVQHYLGKLLNIHPSLLPAYPGLDTHRRALAEHAKIHGASVHFVTNELDGGPVIVQAAVKIHPDDTPITLQQKVLDHEHQIYPEVISWFAQGRLKFYNNQVYLDGQALRKPIRWIEKI